MPVFKTAGINGRLPKRKKPKRLIEPTGQYGTSMRQFELVNMDPNFVYRWADPAGGECGVGAYEACGHKVVKAGSKSAGGINLKLGKAAAGKDIEVDGLVLMAIPKESEDVLSEAHLQEYGRDGMHGQDFSDSKAKRLGSSSVAEVVSALAAEGAVGISVDHDTGDMHGVSNG